MSPKLSRLKLDSVTSCAEYAGVYWLVATDYSTNRVGGSDPFGVLYIGKKKTRDRLNNLANALMFGPNYDSFSHDAAWEYYAGRLSNSVKPTRLEIWFHIIDLPIVRESSQFDETYYEDALLTTYRDALGEYPPFNIAPPRYKPYYGVSQKSGKNLICKTTWMEQRKTGRGICFGLPHYAPQEIMRLAVDLNTF